jgi:hypothetical protein
MVSTGCVLLLYYHEAENKPKYTKLGTISTLNFSVVKPQALYLQSASGLLSSEGLSELDTQDGTLIWLAVDAGRLPGIAGVLRASPYVASSMVLSEFFGFFWGG